MKFGVVVFPGSNCDYDAYKILLDVMHQRAEYLWHKDSSLDNCDCIILPGGFSYGDYLRTGAIARFSPIMKQIIKFARDGGLVLGICNGFQILLEAGLLPGAMLQNSSLRFVCRHIYLKVERNDLPFTKTCQIGDTLKIPVAHKEGNYYIDQAGLLELEREQQVVFRYSTRNGELTEEANPNGSLANIAGITNKQGNVLGLMPHPERASESTLGSDDGKKVFESIVAYFEERG
ncbi:MAG: phosphoribosylformylglycinamidine synthase I [candidate division Zixibacteria bacterium RBG_16_48_11]|nr:MAG: phosphoribosylformylglycinamidine synthase I [candidate division Zixibacteria bacterium RBG_16_48_11]